MCSNFMRYGLVIASLMGVAAVPNWQGCTNSLSQALPYCDTTLSIDQRLDWLVNNLTLEEKIAMISPQPDLGDACGVHTRGKASIGLPNYFWLTETNTAVAASCYTGDPANPYHCATTFVGPMNMGASFNRSSWRAKGNVLGTEMRAFNNLAWNRANRANLIGVTGFGPNINIARNKFHCFPNNLICLSLVCCAGDPRFGRISELPSEDPIHSGAYGAEMIRGMQTEDGEGHPKMIAYLKHFTAYSREEDRMHSEANISNFDLFDTYLPQYELAFEANASGVMCSYDSINGKSLAVLVASFVMRGSCGCECDEAHSRYHTGVPVCASDFLLNQMIRKKWNQPNAFVSTE